MTSRAAPALDNTLRLALEGYGWLPNLRRHRGGRTVATRLAGMRATALCGPEAAAFFYDEDHVRRHGALPEPIQATLFGKGAVHTLDGLSHRQRKEVFWPLLDTAGIARLVELTNDSWDATAATWPQRGPVVLFDEASRIIVRAVSRWTGLPLDEAEVASFAADMVALVDGFATAGPRHWRARRARHRREQWIADLVVRIRNGEAAAPVGSVLERIVVHRDVDGELLDPRLAAVELINVIRPTVAVSWFVAYAAHALHRWPGNRKPLAEGDRAYTEAFAHEVRRFYPFAPFIGGKAVRDLVWDGVDIPEGSMVLLDLYGQNHDPEVWTDPYTFDPQRFIGRVIGEYELVPQGGGDPRSGHRCPGEQITVALLEAFSVHLARLEHTLPEQDLSISLQRIPARVRSGVVIAVPEG